jgi:ABC-type glycerol-3-phosphate transport system permease component
MKRAAAAVVVLLAFAFPLYFALAASLAPEGSLYGGPGGGAPTLEHYRNLVSQRDFFTPLRNSLIVAGATTLVCVVVGSVAAYALARMRFRGRSLVLGAILAAGMFPQIAIVPPLFELLRALGFIDTYPGLVLPYCTFAMPLTVWFLVGYFRQLPPDLEEAAFVDGATRLHALRAVLIPVALPGIATTAVLTFIYCWNELLFALSFTTGFERHTVPVAIALFRGQYQVPWGQILAATVVSTLPVALLVVVFQRRIVSGLTAGAVK